MDYWKTMINYVDYSFDDQRLTKFFHKINESLSSIKEEGPICMVGLKNEFELKSLNLFLMKYQISAIVNHHNSTE